MYNNHLTAKPDGTVRSSMSAEGMSYRRYLIDEARAMSHRLDHVKPFSTTMPMVLAAQPTPAAMDGIDGLLQIGVRSLGRRISQFIQLLGSHADMTPAEAQSAFTMLKLRFNTLLDQLDIFADVITQRSEHHMGVWLAGLDALACDALSITRVYVDPPPLVCYVDRGHGAAIRRARTRLPGGHTNPVGIIRVPRERMVFHGIASSLVHEVGHQGVALLDVITPLRLQLSARARTDGGHADVWQMLERWISEILSDCWAVGMVGVSASTGLIGVVSLPRYFVFRTGLDDPHPFPWIRVKISLAFGERLFPDAQWKRLNRLWEQFYPLDGLPVSKQRLLRRLESRIPRFVQMVVAFRPPVLRGKTLASLFPLSERQPELLRQLYPEWSKNPAKMNIAAPSLVFAVLGQARADHRIAPHQENALLRKMLTAWANQPFITNDHKIYRTCQHK